jgi:hypothetical protein
VQARIMADPAPPGFVAVPASATGFTLQDCHRPIARMIDDPAPAASAAPSAPRQSAQPRSRKEDGMAETFATNSRIFAFQGNDRGTMVRRLSCPGGIGGDA